MTNWRANARCLDADPDTFFPPKGGDANPARDICNGTGRVGPCPVRTDCLEWAISHPEWTRYGVWGGTTEHDRRPLRQQRTRRVAS